MTTSYAQTPFNGADFSKFALDPQPRCPVVFALDTSGSMSGSRIQQLNKGVAALLTGISSDSLALKRVELAVVTFGDDVKVIQHFATVDTIAIPTLNASGGTPMGEAMVKCHELIQERQRIYRAASQKSYRPIIVLITDGGPTDSWEAPSRAVGSLHDTGRLFLFPIGVDQADMAVLGSICSQPALHIEGSDLVPMMKFISDSLRAISNSRPTDNMGIAQPNL